MRHFRIAFIFSLMLTLILGCAKEEIQPDPLNTADDIALKGAKVKKGKDHFVPFKAKFKLTAEFHSFEPIDQKDYQTEWVITESKMGMHVVIRGNGNATHMGKTELVIEQWWKMPHPLAPPMHSYGQGFITFTAANGDKLFATYYGLADHTDDPPTEILTYGIFIDGTGRFEGATGTFLWDGLFVGKFKPNGSTPSGTVFGTGEVTVSGTIKY